MARKRIVSCILRSLLGATLLSGLYTGYCLYAMCPLTSEEAELVILLGLAAGTTILTLLRLCGKNWLPGLYAPILVLLLMIHAWQDAHAVPDSSLLDSHRIAAEPVVWAVVVQSVLHLLCSIAEGTLTRRRYLICLGLTVWTVLYLLFDYFTTAVLAGAYLLGSNVTGLALIRRILTLLGLAVTIWLHVRGARGMQSAQQGGAPFK